ncbi:MAG: hypothetical protein ABIB97_01210 [Patescibacteria group bacterium]
MSFRITPALGPFFQKLFRPIGTFFTTVGFFILVFLYFLIFDPKGKELHKLWGNFEDNFRAIAGSRRCSAHDLLKRPGPSKQRH